MSEVFVFGLFAIVCCTALVRPGYGVIGFYGFVLLDPAWNWRWALPDGFAFQKYIFYSLMIGFVVSGFRYAKLSKLTKYSVLGLLAFLALTFASSTQTIDSAVTEFYLSIIWKVVLAAVMAIGLISNRHHLWWLAAIATIAQAYNAFQINLDYFQTGFSRYAYVPWGSYGVDNNGYSIITVPLFAISFAMMFGEQNAWKKVLFGFVATLQVHQIMLMASRGCMIAAIVVVVITAWFMPKRPLNYAVLASALALGLLLAGPSVIKEFSSSFAAEGELDDSAESRFYLWKAGLRITMDYPILGVGPDAARRLVPKPEYYEGGLSTDDKALHNLFFDISCGMGIFALAGFLFFQLSPVVACFKGRMLIDHNTSIRLAVLAGVPGYLVASMFSSGSLFESGYLLPILGCCCSNLVRDTDPRDQDYEDSVAPIDLDVETTVQQPSVPVE